MDLGRKRLACGITRAVENRAATAQLSRVARGSEWQGSDATKPGDQRPDDPAALSRLTARHGTLRAYAGSNLGHCLFPAGSADASCALKRWRSASAFRKPLSKGARRGGQRPYSAG